MLYSFSRKLSAFLCRSSKDKIDVTAYGLFVLFSNIVYLLVCAAAGLFFDCVWQSLTFYFAFQFAKRYTGGYHAKTEAFCFVISSLSIIICTLIISLSEKTAVLLLLYIFGALSCIFIALKAPLENSEKPLSENEKQLYRKRAIIRTIFLLVISVVLALFKLRNFASAILCALNLSGAFLAIGHLNDRRA